jgi:hypothetical protein
MDIQPTLRRGTPGVKLVPIGLVVLICACTRVNVTPLGSTRDGRRQYEITCNKRATDDGTCNQKAVALCQGSYETQHVGLAASRVVSYNGQVSTAPAERLLLIACNR